MATIIVDTEKTVLVSRFLTPVNGFKVQLLSGTKENFIPDSELNGHCFKYPCEFNRTFCRAVGLENTDDVTIVVSEVSNTAITNLLNFNQIDS